MAGIDDLLALREQQYPGSPGTDSPVQAAETVDPFDAALSTRESEQGRLRASVNQGIKTTPDKASTHQYLSKVTGMPLATVQSQEGEVQAMVKFQEMSDLAKTSPVLRERLLNPDFVAQTQDDAGPLSALANGFKYIVSAPGTERGLAGDTLKAAGVLGLGATAGVGKMIFDTAALPIDLAAGVTGNEGLKNAAASYRAQAKRTGEAMDYFSPSATTSTGKAVVSGLQSAGTNIALLPAGLAREFYATASQAASAVAGLMGLGTGAGAYSEARDAGKNQAQALTYAIPQGVFEYAFEQIPAAKLFHDLEASKSLTKVLAGQVIPENVTEQLTTISQDFNAWMNMNQDKTLKQFLAERPEAAYQTFVATMVGVGAQTTLMHNINKVATAAGDEQQKHYTSTAEFERLQVLMKAATGSKLRERDPSTFAEVAQEMADKTEGAPTEVRFDARTLDEVLNQEELAQLPSIQAQLDEARATGGEVSVPIGELLANVAGTPLEQKLMEHARIGDSEYSQAEVKKASDTAADFLATESKRVIEQSTDAVAHQESANKVKQLYMDQFNEIGRFTKDVNELNAAMVSNMYVALGARLGLTPEQAQAQHPLTITGVNPAKSGDVLNSKMTPDQSKQALVDQGVLKQVGPTMKGVKVYRATAEGEDAKGPRAAGSWVTPNRDIALNVYAKGDESRVVEDYIPEKDLYEAHPDGWVYAPEGTDVTGVQRTADMTFGELLNQGRGDVTTTPAFKKWFGDSKVVDADGKPLVVYRGEHGKTENGEPQTKLGSFTFTNNPEGASKYAQDPNDHRDTAEQPRVVKAYLSIKNPFITSTDDPFIELKDIEEKLGRDEAVRIAKKFSDHIENTNNWQEDEANNFAEYGSAAEFAEKNQDKLGKLYFMVYPFLDDKAEVANLVAKGFDGAIHASNGATAGDIEYRTFGAGQIKSAIGNNGNFDAKDASILHQGPSKGLTVEGYHFSKAERATLDTNHYGTGLKGSGRETYQNASDKRLGKRLSFYVDKGTGVRPEAGVGGIAHKAQLSNIYDSNTDPLRLKKGSQTDFETRVLDAGYSGYLDRMEGDQPGQVILLGDQKVKPEVLGPTTKVEGARKVAPAGERVAFGRDAVLDELRADKSLPSGSLSLSRWRELLSKNPAVLDAFERAGVFKGDLTREMYKSELLKAFESKTEDPVYNQGDKIGALAKIEKHLTDKERSKLNKATAQRLVDYFDSLPHANEFAAVAWAGRAKRGWYKESARAIGQVFGPNAPRFVGLLAAMSPQNSVQTNLLNALNTWKNWIAAGRPQTREEILKVMGDSVEGKGGVNSVLDAWVNNSVRALTTENPGVDMLSGPKVDSFMRNLLGETNEVTNDAWMANFALVDQVMFKGALNQTDAGKGPGYLAMNAKVRQAAKILTEKTGETWTPAEVQETVWSWAKTLYEAQTAEKSATDILMDESLTDDMLRSTPDFKGLFHDAKYEKILRDIGLGGRLSDLDPGSAATEAARTGGETAPFDGLTQSRHENRAAKRLEILRRDGKPGGDILSQSVDGHVVNIGLGVNNDKELSPQEVLDAIKALGVNVVESKVHQSDTEPTVVAKLERALTPEEAHALSVKLKQEAIAQMSEGEGELYGPQADNWKPFNPDYFLALNGQPASAMAQPGGQRGTFNPRTMTISLLENADLSTFHHEMAHFYLELMSSIASQPNAPAAVSADMDKTLGWFGVADLATWNAMSLDEKRQFHEKFAEHYEQYLFEGKAPSKEMHAMFQRFASWMRNVYRSLQDFMKSHNSSLTDEVRGVYDRMLATESEIEATETARKLTPMFTSAEEAGMNSAQWQQYQLAAQDATESAVEDLQARSLRDLKWAISAKNKAVKAVTKDVETKRKAVEAEVRNEVESQPVYVAKSYLDSLKGDRNDADIQFMSEQLGYTSPDEMLRAIAEAEPIRHVIEGMTDQRLLERYGDLTTPKGIEAAANEAVHNEARARFVATELRALEDGVRLKTEADTTVFEKLKECLKS